MARHGPTAVALRHAGLGDEIEVLSDRRQYVRQAGGVLELRLRGMRAVAQASGETGDAAVGQGLVGPRETAKARDQQGHQDEEPERRQPQAGQQSGPGVGAGVTRLDGGPSGR